jgi:hypothetical protein
MTASIVEITNALDEISKHEEGVRFQRLATLLAKQKWPELIACEPKKDLGADARVSSALAADGRGKVLACSITSKLSKIRLDASQVKSHFTDAKVFIFATPGKISNQRQAEWIQDIRDSFDLELLIISREEIVSALMEPRNAVICRTLLKLAVDIEPDISEMIERIARATSAVTAQWFAHRRLDSHPLIDLQAVRLGGTDRPGESLDSTRILEDLLQGQRIVIEAPAGRGKTTSLIQFAKRISSSSGLPFLIDLPEWAKSGRNLLEYIADMPAFVANRVTATELAQSLNVERFTFLFNGWNELSDTACEIIESGLRKVDREFSTAGILVATRAHSVRPPLGEAIHITLAPLTRTERAQYLKSAVGVRAPSLISELEGNRALDGLTRTPLILREVTKLFQAGRALPPTKVGIIDSVIRLMEETVEHCNELRRPPLNGNATAYLSELAVHLTASGDVTISEMEARSVCNLASRALRTEEQVTQESEPGEVLDALCSHHVLEKIDYPASSYRFEHQQFQEFYAALSLDRALISVLREGEGRGFEFVRDFVNVVSWGESLRMIAEKLGSTSNDISNQPTALDRGKKLVELAMEVDLVFASDLARLAGDVISREVASDLGHRIREWYNVSDQNHRECALAAMFAGGSTDFNDVLIPLLTNVDGQVRLATYRAWPEFHFSTLSRDWQSIVAGWKEDARIDFVSEITINHARTEVAEYFSTSDPCVAVRIKAIEALSWIGASDQVKRALENLPKASLADALVQMDSRDIPISFLSEVSNAYRERLTRITDPRQRIRIFLKHPELAGSKMDAVLKNEITCLPTEKQALYDERTLRTALEAVWQSDKEWVSEWVARRIVLGFLWHESWVSLVTNISSTLRRELLDKLVNETPDHKEGRIISILSVVADVDFARDVFGRICAFRRERNEAGAGTNQVRSVILRHLEDLFRQIPPVTTVKSLLDIFSQEFDPVAFCAVAEVFNRIGREDLDLRGALPEDLRQALRRYLKAGIPPLMSLDDLTGQSLASLASALSVVGDREDMADLEILIKADQLRHQRIREASAKGQRFHGIVTWDRWYLEAVLALDREHADAILLPLLNDDGYDVEAAKCLLKLATSEGHKQEGFRVGTNYALIWNARNGKPSTQLIEERRQRFSTALHERVSGLLRVCTTSTGPKANTYRLSELAVILAALDGRDSVSLIMQVVALPGRWMAGRRVEALKGLLFAGVRLAAEAALNILNPVIDELCAEGIYNNDNQNMWLLKSALCLLPFVGPADTGISRLREVLEKIKFPAHELADIFSSLGESRSPAALSFLREIAESDATQIEYILTAWITAVAKLPLPESREILISFLDPRENDSLAQLKISNDNARLLASRIGDIALSDVGTKRRIIQLLGQQLSPDRRFLLLAVVGAMGTPEAILAALPMITDGPGLSVPYELGRAFEHLFLEHRPYGPSDNTYTVVSKASNDVRSQLLMLVRNDAQRRASAFSMLGRIEQWHLEYGKPNSEPRHPALETGIPWPPLELLRDNPNNFSSSSYVRRVHFFDRGSIPLT